MDYVNTRCKCFIIILLINFFFYIIYLFDISMSYLRCDYIFNVYYAYNPHVTSNLSIYTLFKKILPSNKSLVIKYLCIVMTHVIRECTFYKVYNSIDQRNVTKFNVKCIKICKPKNYIIYHYINSITNLFSIYKWVMVNS